MIKHRIAKGIIRQYMLYNKFDGWTSFWNTIYYIDDNAKSNSRLIKHELKHIEQIQREGRLKFLIKYSLYHLKYGYWLNPYEVEARRAEDE